jgi:hypothetical protein
MVPFGISSRLGRGQDRCEYANTLILQGDTPKSLVQNSIWARIRSTSQLVVGGVDLGERWPSSWAYVRSAPRVTGCQSCSTHHCAPRHWHRPRRSTAGHGGPNLDRLHSEAAFAHLCGAAPVPASSGKTTRHRLNWGGDRQANSALHMIAVVRLRYCPRTRA